MIIQIIQSSLLIINKILATFLISLGIARSTMCLIQRDWDIDGLVQERRNSSGVTSFLH